MSEKNDSTHFMGFTYDKLSRELNWFEVAPERIGPFELIKWAVACGHWTTYDDEVTGRLAWLGPVGIEPVKGAVYNLVYDDNQAILLMKKHYSIWYKQRQAIKEAFEAQSKLIELAASNSEPPSPPNPDKPFDIENDDD